MRAVQAIYSPQRREEREDFRAAACRTSLPANAASGFIFFKIRQNSAITLRSLRLCGEIFSLLTLILSLACARVPQDPIEPPQVLTDSIPFIYPLDLWDNNVSGQTVLLLRVSATGQVDSVAVDASSGYAEFDSAAVQGAHRLRFIAARQGDRRVPMWTKVPVRFSRDTTTKMGIGGS